MLYAVTFFVVNGYVKLLCFCVAGFYLCNLRFGISLSMFPCVTVILVPRDEVLQH